MKELCQPSINGWGRPIAPIPIQATDFGLRHHMIQQVQNTCQFYGLPGDDANRHIDKFLEVTQHLKQNGVSDDTLRLSLFPYYLTHHATTWHQDTINATAGGTFMQKTPEECYDLIKNMTAHHNHWDTSATRDETSRTISSTTTTESPEVVRQLEMMNKNFLDMMRQIQSVKSVIPKYETCGGPHSFTECLAIDGYTQEAVYATTGNHNSGGIPTNHKNNQNQGNYQSSNNQGRGKNFNKGNNNYQALNFQAPNNQIQVGLSNELTNYMKSNEATLRAMQIQMTNMKTELRNEFKSSLDARTNKIENQNNQMMNMLTNLTMQKQNASGSGSLPSNIVANPRGDVKAITTRSGVAYDGPTIPPTPSPLPKEVERETKATKDKVQSTSSESTAHVQPLVVQVSILEPEVTPKPNPKPSIPYPSRLNVGNKSSYKLNTAKDLRLPEEVKDCMKIKTCEEEIKTFMEFESAQSNTIVKLPILKLGEYEMWVIRIKQYSHVQDYALWEVIENNSWVSVPQTVQENGTSVTKMSIPVTAEEKTNKKNDVNARSLLLMALPNEHQLTFSQQLAILGVVITQEDLNSKFLRSLPPEWNTHVVVWMNKADIETMSIDDLYNNFKIVEQDVKKAVGASSGAQNLAFMTAPSTRSTNDVNTVNPAYEVSTVNSNINTACPQVSTANFSDNTVYDFMVENLNGSNLLQHDLEQIHEDNLEAMDLKWQLSLLSMRAKRYFQRTGKKNFINANDTAGYDKSKVECFNCHKMGHFVRECRAPRNKEGQFKYQDNTRK
ncbi:reverse transcriptase domain-containing protein [Tanacetum coccineum]